VTFNRLSYVDLAGTASDGIALSDEEAEQLASLDPGEAWNQLARRHQCDHSEMEVRRRVLRNGVTTYHRQCLRCGTGAGAVKKTSLANPWKLSEFDEKAAEQWWETCDRNRKKLQAAQERARTSRDTEWWEWYDGYLETPAWRRRREAVLKRADYRCEGCGINRATQAHHLTYKRAGEEMLFDLVAICDVCHERVHPRTGSQ